MSELTIVLVTGSKSGIGRGILATYAERANTIAVAAIRDGPDSTAAEDLASLPTGNGSKVIVARYDAGSTTAAIEMTAYLRKEHDIQHLDVVVAKCGYSEAIWTSQECESGGASGTYLDKHNRPHPTLSGHHRTTQSISKRAKVLHHFLRHGFEHSDG